jgi:hypothetical protein
LRDDGFPPCGCGTAHAPAVPKGISTYEDAVPFTGTP